MQIFTVRDMFEEAVRIFPDKEAISDSRESVTWKELSAQTMQVAARLLAAGLAKGDRVAIVMENDANQVAAMLGVMQAGGVCINVNQRLKARQVAHLITDSGAKIALVHPALRAKIGDQHMTVIESDTLFIAGATVSARLPRLIDQDLAIFIYTSGSTGKPKGVMFRHADVVMCAKIMVEACGHRATDRTLCTLPFSADHALTLLYMTLLTGSTLVLRNTFLAQDITQALHNERITVYSGITPIWPILYGSRSDFAKQSFPELRYVSLGGGYPPKRVMDQIMTQFSGKTDIYMLYGLTESNWTTYVPPKMLKEKFGSLGITLPNVEVVILDADGEPVSEGEEGELVHRGGVIAAGYWNNPEKTAKTFRTLHGERVVYSGDLVTRDADGYIYYKGRKDGQIKVQGFRVATQDIIDCMYETELVDEACIFSIPDETIEQRIIACVTPKIGAEQVKKQVLEHLAKELPSYMVPRELYLLDHLPYTHSHKIDVVRLRELYEANKIEEAIPFKQ